MFIVVVLSTQSTFGLQENSSKNNNLATSEKLSMNSESNQTLFPGKVNTIKIPHINFIPESQLGNISDILTGYMTVVSILLATAGLVLGTAPEYTSNKKRKDYRTFINFMLGATILIIFYSIFLIAVTGEMQLDLVGFGALLIPVYAISNLTRRRLGEEKVG